MGIDRDLDGVLDADVPPPQLQIAGDSGSNLTINWPFSAAGYQLESTTGLPPGSWTSVTNAIEIFAGRNYVTNPPTPGAGFYRLRFPLP
jgi:hypothetical protein